MFLYIEYRILLRLSTAVFHIRRNNRQIRAKIEKVKTDIADREALAGAEANESNARGDADQSFSNF